MQGAAKLGVELTARQQDQFRIYHEELLAWSQRANVTAILGYEDVQLKHFLDSLTPAILFEQGANKAELATVDVGTGAGSPGLSLKIAFPDLPMLLLESTRKKTLFLNHLAEKLKLEGLEILTERAEEIGQWPKYRERFSLVLSRAVARLPSLAELLLPLCAIGGLVVAMKKGDIAAELIEASRAVDVLGGRLRDVRDVALEELGGERKLVVIEKTSATPHKYPRRPGMPLKRPISN